MFATHDSCCIYYIYLKYEKNPHLSVTKLTFLHLVIFGYEEASFHLNPSFATREQPQLLLKGS